MTGVSPALPAGSLSSGRSAALLVLNVTRNTTGLAVLLGILLSIYMRFTNDVFFTRINLQNILLQVAILAVASVGMTAVIIASELDLSIGSGAALVGVVGAKVMADGSGGWLIPAGLLAGLGVGLAIGMINSFSVNVLKVDSIIATLGMLVILRGLSRWIAGGQTIGGGVNTSLATFSEFINSKFLGIQMILWIAAAFVLVCDALLRVTPFGAHLYLIGSNAEGSRRGGVRVRWVRTGAFLVAGSATALAGLLLMGHVELGQPNAAGLLELYAAAAVVLGGNSLRGGDGSIARTVVGVLFIGLVQNSLNLSGMQSDLQQVVIGTIFILAAASELIRRRGF